MKGSTSYPQTSSVFQAAMISFSLSEVEWAFKFNKILKIQKKKFIHEIDRICNLAYWNSQMNTIFKFDKISGFDETN